MKVTNSGKHLVIGSVTCLFAVLLLAVPGRALADDLLSDPGANTDGVVEDPADDVTEAVNAVTEAVEDGAEGVTTAVGNSVNDANGATNDAADDVTETVGKAMDSAKTTKNDVTGVGNTLTGIIGTVGRISGSDAGDMPEDQSRSESRTQVKDHAGSSVKVSGVSDPGSRQWEPVNPLGLGMTLRSSRVLLGPTLATAGSGESDPCVDDPQSVCLGLLFGLGEYANYGDDVLGIIATTGIGVIGLIVMALGLGIGGSGALVAGRDHSEGAVSRAR